MKNSIVCKYLKLEFIEVTPDNFKNVYNDNKQLPVAGTIKFFKTSVPDLTENSPAPSRSPFTPEYSCGEDNNRCDIKGETDKQAQVTVSLTIFNKIEVEQDGGAIHLVNTALMCENVQFDRCKSKTGGGGGIYLNNSIDKKSEVKLENLQFKDCKALYGGGVYVYSSSENDSSQCFSLNIQMK